MIECQTHDEEGRLRALVDLDILDSEPERVFDDFTWLAKEIAQVPICAITLVDSERQWFKSKQGMEVDSTPREGGLCARAILQDDPLVIEDTLQDIHFKDNAMVTEAMGIRFYMGFPLKSTRGYRIGALCLVDSQPRKLTEDVIEKVAVIARRVMHELENRRLRNKQKRILAEDLGVKSLNNQTADSLLPCIRQPLAAILDSINFMLEDAKVTGDQKQDLLGIHHATRQLFEYFDTMLLDPKSGWYVQGMKSEKVDVRQALENIQGIFSVILRHRNIQLTTKVCDSVPEDVVIDSVAFNQVLMVLFDEMLTYANREVHICVEIPAEYQEPALLSIVFRGSTDASTATETPPISYLSPGDQNQLRMLKLKYLRRKLNSMGGFLVNPTSCPSEVTAMIPVEREPASQGTEANWLHFNVAYVGRDPVGEVMLSRYLSQLGHHAIVMSNIEELFAEFLDNAFDCILLDSSLEWSTISSLQEMLNIFQHGQKIQVPIIGIASNKANVERFAEHGIQAILKPIDRERLQQALCANL